MLLHLNAAPTPTPRPRVVPVQQFERSCNSRKEFFLPPHSFFRQQRRGLSLNKGTQKQRTRPLDPPSHVCVVSPRGGSEGGVTVLFYTFSNVVYFRYFPSFLTAGGAASFFLQIVEPFIRLKFGTDFCRHTLFFLPRWRNFSSYTHSLSV